MFGLLEPVSSLWFVLPLRGQTDRVTDWVNGNQNSRLVNFVHAIYRNTAAKVKDGIKNFRLVHSDRENRTLFSMFRCFSAESTLAYTNRRYFFAFFKRARSASHLSPSRVSNAPRTLRACLYSPEKCENITPVMKARTTQKVVFHLLSNRIFRKPFVNSKPTGSLFLLEQERETGRTRTGCLLGTLARSFAFILPHAWYSGVAAVVVFFFLQMYKLNVLGLN